MKDEKNKYEKKKDRKSLKERMKNPSPHLKQAGQGLLRDLVVGVVAGGATGAIIGRPSLVVGLVVNAAGHFMEMPGISSFGMGMMAANGFQGDGVTLNGEETAMERAKQRLLNYKNNFTQKIYLDKIMKKADEKKTTESDKPVGEVKYFVYPGSENADMSGMDMTALDNIENQIIQSAENYQQKTPVPRVEKEVSGADETLMMRDPLY